MILFYAVGHWSSWFNAMISLQDRKQISTAADYAGNPDFNSTSGNSMADTDAMFLQEVVKICDDRCFDRSVLCIYPFAQKYFMTGVMMGSVKSKK